jgi:signal transduction histidine kinase
MARTEEELLLFLEPFTRGSTGPGKGLNLFPVRLIVASWAGRLRVQSTPGEGTRFLICFRDQCQRIHSS